jgi:hypothetical protein
MERHKERGRRREAEFNSQLDQPVSLPYFCPAPLHVLVIPEYTKGFFLAGILLQEREKTEEGEGGWEGGMEGLKERGRREARTFST